MGDTSRGCPIVCAGLGVFHARLKFETILSQSGKGHTRGNLPMSVLPSNKHIHIDTHTILYVMDCDCERCNIIEL